MISKSSANIYFVVELQLMVSGIKFKHGIRNTIPNFIWKLLIFHNGKLLFYFLYTHYLYGGPKLYSTVVYIRTVVPQRIFLNILLYLYHVFLILVLILWSRSIYNSLKQQHKNRNYSNISSATPPNEQQPLNFITLFFTYYFFAGVLPNLIYYVMILRLYISGTHNVECYINDYWHWK